MMIRTMNSMRFKDWSGVPVGWHKFNQTHFELIVQNFDPMMTGNLPVNKVLFYLILLNSKVPLKEEVQSLIDRLNLMSWAEGEDWKGKVCWGNFITAPTWFDAFEYSVDMQYAKPFNRLKQIKGLVFDILKSDHDSLDIKEFEKLIKTRMKEHEDDEVTYFDLLFKTKED